MSRFNRLHNAIPILHTQSRYRNLVRHVSRVVRQQHIQPVVVDQKRVTNHRLPGHHVDFGQALEVIARVGTDETLEGLFGKNRVVMLFRIHTLPHARQMVVLSTVLRVTQMHTLPTITA